MFNRGHWKKLVEDDLGPRVANTNAKGIPNYNVSGADESSFTTDFLTDRIIEFIARNTGQPFCAMVSYPDPHGPNSVRPPYDIAYDHLPFRQPASALDPGEGLPPYAATRQDGFNPASMARYFGMVKCIDDNVGRILTALHKGIAYRPARAGRERAQLVAHRYLLLDLIVANDKVGIANSLKAVACVDKA